MDDSLKTALRRMCLEITQRHDLRSDFFENLVSQSDWAFVIQSHALVEAAVSDGLTQLSGDPRLRKIFDRLPLSDSGAGKLAFAKAYGIIDSPQATFIQFFSELRNQLVHNVGNIHFSFRDHVASLDANQLKSWTKRITAIASEPSRPGLESIAREQPMVALWFAVVVLVHGLASIEDTSKQ